MGSAKVCDPDIWSVSPTAASLQALSCALRSRCVCLGRGRAGHLMCRVCLLPPQVRYRREHLSARQPPYFPLLEDLMRDGSDGAALLAVVHYYCPEHMKLDGECTAPTTPVLGAAGWGRVETAGGTVHMLVAPALVTGHVAQALGWVSALRPLFLLRD